MEPYSNFKEYSYTWKIENFSELLSEGIDSAHFNVNVLEASKWKMVLYPNGQSGDTKVLSILICRLDLNINFPLRFELTISILSTDASSHVSKKIEIFCVEKGSYHGFYWFMKREELFAKRSVYLPQDTLTIQCYIVRKEDIPEFSLGEENESRPQIETDINGLNNDLYNLYLNGKFSDIKIKTLEQTLSVHKTILCARSPVFSAMFENETEEKKSNMVDLTEFDYETVNLMIKFLYSDSIENLNRDQAVKLFVTAVRYKILPLQQQCSSVLKKCFSDVNICETYYQADMYQDIDLKVAVEEYVFIYSYRIFKSCEWKAFMRSNYKLSAEIMHKLWIKNFDD